MLHEGLSVEVICKSLSLDENTVYRYARKFKEEGLEKYLDDAWVKYEGKLSEEQTQLLIAHLETHLYPDAKSICAYVAERFGVRFCESGMRAWLHRHGFVYKQAKPVARKADAEAQRAFLEERLPPLLEEVEAGKAEVYFMDGTHPTHNTSGAKGWIRSGKEYRIDCNSGRHRVNINAAVRAIKPEHVVYDMPERINAQSTLCLLRKLLRKHPKKKIYVICDNAGYYRCKELKEWLEGQRIELVFLPPYSPNLNIIERLWGYLKKKVIGSIYYDTFSRFRERIVEFFDNIKDHKENLRTLLTLNFRTVDNTSVHFSQTTLR